jgi:periplasmic divalent cation tolerance protein
MSIFIALVACPSEEVATALARLLVDGELAACVQVLPGITSVYRWKGEVCVDTEALLIIKSSLDCKDRVSKAIEENHPYDVPEFIVLSPSDVSTRYQEWVMSNVNAEKTSDREGSKTF